MKDKAKAEKAKKDKEEAELKPVFVGSVMDEDAADYFDKVAASRTPHLGKFEREKEKKRVREARKEQESKKKEEETTKYILGSRLNSYQFDLYPFSERVAVVFGRRRRAQSSRARLKS